MCRRLFAALVAALLLAAPAAGSTYFTSPSTTIGCVYVRIDGDRSVRCDLAGVDHPKPRPDNCDLEYGDAFALADHGRTFRVCHGDTARDGQHLW